MKIKIEFDQNSIINFLIADISITAIKFYIVQSIPGLYLYNSIANILISAILILFLVPALIAVFKRKPLFVTGTCIFFLMLICGQILIFPHNASMILSYMPKMIGMSLGCLIAAFGLIDFETFYHKLVVVSRIIIIFAAVQFISYEFLGVVGTEQLDYNMSFGFYLVIPTIVMFNHSLENIKMNKVVDNIFAFCGLFMAVIMGARGSILAILIGWILCCLIKMDVHRIKDFLIMIGSLVIGVVFLFSYENIALLLYNFLLSKNLNSRLLLMLVSGSITSTTGRDSLQDSVKELILEHPLLGNGMLCDLRSHNIFIEAMLFFGIPVGVVIIVFLIFQWIKPLFESNRKRDIMLIFLCYAVVDSLLNLTVLGKDMFWIYLGMALSTKISLKRKET